MFEDWQTLQIPKESNVIPSVVDGKQHLVQYLIESNKPELVLLSTIE